MVAERISGLHVQHANLVYVPKWWANAIQNVLKKQIISICLVSSEKVIVTRANNVREEVIGSLEWLLPD